MASTNKTTHYELSQYVGSDKPTYLTDYNGDMLAIDTGIYNAQTKADSAYTAAREADTKAGNAQTTANTAVTNAGTANTNIGTMANLNTTDKTSLVDAINEVNNTLNFTSFKEYNTSSADVTIGNNLHIDGFYIQLAKTQNGNYAKVYGQIAGYANTSDTNSTTFTLSNTGLTIASQFTVASVGITSRSQNVSGTDVVSYVTRADVVFNTDGTITIKTNETWETGRYYTIILHPVVIQTKSFGDQPV